MERIRKLVIAVEVRHCHFARLDVSYYEGVGKESAGDTRSLIDTLGTSASSFAIAIAIAITINQVLPHLAYWRLGLPPRVRYL